MNMSWWRRTCWCLIKTSYICFVLTGPLNIFFHFWIFIFNWHLIRFCIRADCMPSECNQLHPSSFPSKFSGFSSQLLYKHQQLELCDQYRHSTGKIQALALTNTCTLFLFQLFLFFYIYSAWCNSWRHYNKD